MSTGRIFLSPPHLGGTERDHLLRALDSGYVAPAGPQLAEFEERFAETCGLNACVAVSSGTAALHLALDVLGVGPGDLVLASTLTFIGSVTPAVQLGADVAFVDADRETWNMDPRLLALALDELEARGRTPKAVVPTDLYGQCADMDAICDVCAPRGIQVVADSAEAVGAAYRGRHAGKGARCAAYSFNGNKIITTSGGGMLGSDDRTLIDKARWLSQQAKDPAPHYEHTRLGYNYRMSNLLAGVGLAQLGVLDARVARRREIFEWYERRLKPLGLEFMPEADYGVSNRWLSVVLLPPEGPAPETVRQALEKENIESRPVWKPMHLQPVFADRKRFGGAVAEEFFARGLCLPSGTAMDKDDLQRVARALERALGRLG